MEKIKDNFITCFDEEARDKINEIIDYCIKLMDKTKVQDIEQMVLSDRLKTLEDKVKFIMKNSYWSLIDNLSAEVDDSKERKSLQDLWDEENEVNVNRSFYVNSEPTVNKAIFINDEQYEKFRNGEVVKIEISEPTVKESITPYDIKSQTTRTIIEPTDNSEKIEEIISEFDVLFEKEFPNYLHQYEINYIKFWLRDKLKGL